MRRTKRREYEEEEVYSLNLEEIKNKDMTVEELHDIAKRNKAYLTYRTKSLLTNKGWAEALGISEERDRVYASMTERVPNVILNRAFMAYKKIRRIINTMKRGYL